MQRPVRTAGLAGILALSLLSGWISAREAPQDVQEPPSEPSGPAAEGPSGEPWSVRGRLTSRYQLRDSTLDERDQDLFTYLSLSGGSARHHPVTVSLFGRSAWDLEGNGLGGFQRSLSSLEDTRGTSHDLRLVRAWVGLHEVIEDGELRVGRQPLFETPVLLNLDGVTARAPAEVLEWPGEFLFYGGRPHHVWEGPAQGDAAAGAALSLAPWRGGHTRLDLMRVHDAQLFGDRSNTLVGAEIAQAAEDGRWWASLGGTFLDGSQRDVDLEAVWNDVENGWQVLFFAHALRSRQSANTLEYDPFTAVLLDEEPFYEAQLIVGKRFSEAPLGVGEAWRLDGGAYGRTLRDSAAESEFNREYQRWWLGLSLEGFPWEDAELGVTSEYWDSGVDEISSAGAELRAWFGEDLEASLGTQYTLYRYDFFAELERDDVRSYELRLDYQLLESLRLRLSLEHLEDDLENYEIGWIQAELSF